MKPSRPKKGTAASKTTSKSKPSKTASSARAAKSSAKGKPPTRATGKKAPAAPKKAAPKKAAPKSKGASAQSTSKSAANQRGARAAQQEHGHAHSHPHEHRHAHEHGHEEHDHDHDHDHGDHDHDHDHANGHSGHDHHDHDHHGHDHDHDHAHYIAVPSVRPQPLIAVHDVGASARWYAQLLAAERVGGDTHGNTYDRVVSDEQLILQLHAWDEENHPNLTGKDTARLGHGMLLWFEVDDFDDAVKRARDLGAEILEEPHVNPGPAHREFWIRDPDGYVVVIVSPDGEVEEEVADALHARGEQA